MRSKEIQLNPSSISKVHLEKYEQDFTFIVNGKKYKTCRIISDLLSSKINEMHLADPLINTFNINTQHEEIIEILCPISIELNLKNEETELTIDNVLTLLETHNKLKSIYSTEIEREISFCAAHFYELEEKKKEELKCLDIDIIINIINHSQLQLSDEDQLLSFANDLYSQEHQNYNIYEFVDFANVSSSEMAKFISLFDINDITGNTWQVICERLKCEVKTENKNENEMSRYAKKKIQFDKSNTMNGIIKYFMNQSNGQIENEINITASSVVDSNECFHPKNVALFDHQTKFFCSNNYPNSWICFEFRNHRVIPTGYTIRTSVNGYANGHQPKSWCIEGSNDNNGWIMLDNVNNCNYTKGTDSPRTHTFSINNQNLNEFKFIRMKLTDTNWSSCHNFFIDAFEIYGSII